MRLLVVAAILSVVASVNYVANTDLGPCTCDLTQNACDEKCCCDPDCSSQQILVFQQTVGCAPSAPQSLADKLKCVSASLADHSQLDSQWIGNQLCISRNNNPTMGLFLTDPGGYPYTSAQFSTHFPGTSGFEDSTAEVLVTALQYSPGMAVRAVYPASTAQTYLTLPHQDGTSCSDANPVAFLGDDTSTTCTRTVAKLGAAECLGAFSPGGYAGVNVLPYPAAATSAGLPITVTYQCVNTSLPFPSDCTLFTPGAASSVDGSSTTCLNMFRGVSYSIVYNNQFVIASVAATVLVGSAPLTTTPFSFTQSFTAAFQQQGSGVPRSRSGNPGYKQGLPVLVGSLSGGVISVSSLSYPSGGGDGTCGSAATAFSPALFGTDAIGGCTVMLNSSDFVDCAALSARFKAYLTANSGLTHVAQWGGSDPTVTSDWTDILMDDLPPQPPQGVGTTCQNVYTQLKLQILYVELGAALNPQARIAGARIVYGFGTAAYTCFGAGCSSGALQPFELRAVVDFVAVPEEAPTDVYPPRPNFFPRLPTGLFYPFMLPGDSAGVALSAPTFSLIAAMIASMATIVLLSS